MRNYPGKKYLKYYRKDLRGGYEYCGDYYYFDGEEITLKKKKALLWLFAVLSIVISVVSGCIRAAGMSDTPYTVIPMMLEVVSAVIYAVFLFNFTSEGEPLKEYTWRDTVKKLPILAIITSCIAATAFIGSIVYIILNGAEGKVAMTCLYDVLKVLNVGCCLTSVLINRSMKWNKK